MSKRMIHENITTSDKFANISYQAECLYFRLLTQTDDYGNTRASSGYVKDICFPRKKMDKNISYDLVEKWLQELIKIGLVIKYKVNEIYYLHFFKFEDFQTLRKDRLKNSSIPCYEPLRSNGCQMSADCPHELEVELELEVNKKEKEFKIFDNEDLKHLKITEQENQKLLNTYTFSDINNYYEKLSLYIGSTGKRYKSHYMTILNWLKRDGIKTKQEIERIRKDGF